MIKTEFEWAKTERYYKIQNIAYKMPWMTDSNQSKWKRVRYKYWYELLKFLRSIHWNVGKNSIMRSHRVQSIPDWFDNNMIMPTEYLSSQSLLLFLLFVQHLRFHFRITNLTTDIMANNCDDKNINNNKIEKRLSRLLLFLFYKKRKKCIKCTDFIGKVWSLSCFEQRDSNASLVLRRWKNGSFIANSMILWCYWTTCKLCREKNMEAKKNSYFCLPFLCTKWRSGSAWFHILLKSAFNDQLTSFFMGFSGIIVQHSAPILKHFG